MEKGPRVSAVSTDILGAVGFSAAKLKAVLPSRMNITHLEVVGVRVGLGKFIHELEEEGYVISHIHGRIGTPEVRTLYQRFLWHAANTVVMPTDKLAELFPTKRLLVHESEARQAGRMDAFLANKTPFVWVENHSKGDRGLARARKVVATLTKAGVPSGIMFDLAHHMGAHDLYSGKRLGFLWDRVLQTLSSSKNTIAGLHIPVGTNTDDALPIKKMSDSQLAELAHVMPSSVKRVVVENQQDGKQLYLKWSEIPEVRKRTRAMLKRLQKAGILDFG